MDHIAWNSCNPKQTLLLIWRKKKGLHLPHLKHKCVFVIWFWRPYNSTSVEDNTDVFEGKVLGWYPSPPTLVLDWLLGKMIFEHQRQMIHPESCQIHKVFLSEDDLPRGTHQKCNLRQPFIFALFLGMSNNNLPKAPKLIQFYCLSDGFKRLWLFFRPGKQWSFKRHITVILKA